MGITPPVHKRPDGARGGQEEAQDCPRRSKSFPDMQKSIFRTKISEMFRTRPDASERLQMHQTASGQVQTGPSRSEQIQKFQKTCEGWKNINNITNNSENAPKKIGKFAKSRKKHGTNSQKIGRNLEKSKNLREIISVTGMS